VPAQKKLSITKIEYQMKTIKNIIKHSLCILLVAGAVGCTTTQDKTDNTPKRIILKEQTQVNGYYMYIIEIEGKEYFVNGRGGVEALSTCN
jgi:hypothetical protein